MEFDSRRIESVPYGRRQWHQIHWQVFMRLVGIRVLMTSQKRCHDCAIGPQQKAIDPIDKSAIIDQVSETGSEISSNST